MHNRVLVQLVNDLHRDDAVGQQVLLLDELARSMGWETSILCRRLATPLAGPTSVLKVRNWTRVPPSAHLVLHHSIGSDLVPLFCGAERAQRRTVIYHNITPPSLLGTDQGLAAAAHRGLRQLQPLAGAADLLVGCSEFNLRELRPLGFRQLVVSPLAPPASRIAVLQKVAGLRGETESEPLQPTVPDPFRVLVVGRIVRNKNLPLALETVPILNRLLAGRPVEYRIIGPRTEPSHLEELERLRAELGCSSEQWRVLGPLDTTELMEEYRRGGALLSTSVHEGFGMPPVEAMHGGLPVVALAAGALPEVLGDHPGLVVPDHGDMVNPPSSSHETLAPKLADRLAKVALDFSWRQSLLEYQFDRARRLYTPEAQQEQLTQLFQLRQ